MQRKGVDNWKGQTLEIVINLERLLDRELLDEEIFDCVSVQGRKPKWFKCGEKEQARSDCETTRKNGILATATQEVIKAKWNETTS